MCFFVPSLIFKFHIFSVSYQVRERFSSPPMFLSFPHPLVCTDTSWFSLTILSMQIYHNLGLNLYSLFTSLLHNYYSQLSKYTTQFRFFFWFSFLFCLELIITMFWSLHLIFYVCKPYYQNFCKSDKTLNKLNIIGQVIYNFL